MEQKYGKSHAEGMVSMHNAIAEELGIKEALSALSPSTAASKQGQDSQNRTTAAPDWQGEPPQNPLKVLSLEAKELAEFEQSERRDLCLKHF